MESVGSDDRYFEGLLTVQMKDKQGEVTIVDELYKVLPVWIDRGAPISDTHTNRIVGKGINYSRTTVKNDDGEELPAIKITGKIFKNYELDNVIWEKIKNNEYKGLSFGGATRSARSPIRMKDGSTAYALGDLEHYEVAVCKDPAVPMAIITDFNQIAKANFNSSVRDDGKMVIQCDNMGCYVNKDSLIKIEDDEDENTQVTILDEWENETHPDKNGKTEGLRTTKSDLLTVMEGDKPENYEAVEQGRSRGRAIDKKDNPCWEGYEQYGMKDKNGKQVPNCVKKAEVTQCAHCNGTGYHGDEKCPKCGGTGKLEVNKAEEDKEKKPLNKPMRDDGDKKFKVYVRDPKTGNIVTVRFGDPNMEIKRDDPERRASFRARHDCDNAKDITTPQYWSCKMWEKNTSVTDHTNKAGGGYADNDNFADPDTSLLLDDDEEKKKFMEKKEMMDAVDDMPDKKDVEKAIEILEKAGYRVDTEDRNNGTEINDTIREKRQFNGTNGTLSEELPQYNNMKADLNESQTFEQKVQALIREGKSRESAEKIVGSFVHKVEASSGSGGAGIGGANLTNGGTLTTDTDGVRNAVYNRRKRKKSRDISNTNAGGVMESAYNQDPPNAQRLNNKSDNVDLDKIIEEETANIKGKKGGGGHRSLATRLTSRQNAKKKAIRDVNKIHALMKLNAIKKLHISGGLGSRGLGSEGGYTQGSGESTQVSNTRKRPEDDRVKVKAKGKYEQGGRYFNSYEVPVGDVPNVEGTTLRQGKPQTKESKRRRAATRLMGDAKQRKVMSNFSNFQNMVNPDKKTIKERKLDEERTNRLYND